MYYSSLVRFPISSRFPVSFQSTPASFMTKADYKVHVERQTAIIALEKNKFSSVAWSCLTATPWITARQASLSITNSQSLLKFMSIESVMPSSHLILSRPLLLPPSIFPSIRVFQMSQFFAWGSQSIGVSASAWVLPGNTQDWSLEWTGWISLQSKGLSRVFSNTTVQKHQFFSLHIWSEKELWRWSGPFKLNRLKFPPPGILFSDQWGSECCSSNIFLVILASAKRAEGNIWKVFLWTKSRWGICDLRVGWGKKKILMT